VFLSVHFLNKRLLHVGGTLCETAILDVPKGKTHSVVVLQCLEKFFETQGKVMIPELVLNPEAYVRKGTRCVDHFYRYAMPVSQYKQCYWVSGKQYCWF
jgi:hypothetical protein